MGGKIESAGLALPSSGWWLDTDEEMLENVAGMAGVRIQHSPSHVGLKLPCSIAGHIMLAATSYPRDGCIAAVSELLLNCVRLVILVKRLDAGKACSSRAV